MNNNSLYRIVQTLSQGSISSVQSGNDLNELDRYLHVKRDIEDVLCAEMNALNDSKGGIVLLVGSAGDGKSHLVSTIRNRPEYKDFVFYNDATESFSPSKTAVDTLKEVLINFSDDNISSTSSKMLLNINHGKLNAFIEDSESKIKYSKLIDYVSKIYEDGRRELPSNPRIKVVQFNNVQIFNFYKDRSDVDYPVDSTFLRSYLEKITVKDVSNPFYRAYLESKPIDESKADPLILNYEMLQLPAIQDSIIKYTIEAIVRFKLIVTPREFQDFIYSILVFDDAEEYSEAKHFVEALLPTLMFNGTRSKMQRILSQLDPLKASNTLHDSDLALLFTSPKIPDGYIDESLFPVDSLIMTKVASMYKNNRKNVMRTTQFLFRLKHLCCYHSEKSEYKEFLKILLGFYNYNGQTIYKLYDMVHNVIPRHYGSYTSPENTVPLNIQGSHYKLFVTIEKPKPGDPSVIYQTSSMFSLKLILKWRIGGSDVYLPVDYSLYEYLSSLDKGRLSLNYESDKNLTFSRFIRELVSHSNCEDEVVVMTSDNRKFKFSKEFNILSFRPC